jgi:hypothetical protein
MDGASPSAETNLGIMRFPGLARWNLSMLRRFAENISEANPFGFP